MTPERRSAHRERPAALSYLEFRPEGGGIVLNASDQGLAFHAATPVRQSSPILLCISPQPMQRIELTGEIAWMDATQKFGGLRFTGLTADTRQQVLQWLTQTTEPDSADKAFPALSCALGEEADARSHAQTGTPDPSSPLPGSHNVTPTRADAKVVAVRGFSGAATRVLMQEPSSQERDSPTPRSPLLRSLATGFVIFVFASMVFLILQNFRSEIGSSLIRIGKTLKDNGDSQPGTSLSKPASHSNSNAGNAPVVPPSPPQTSPAETSDRSDTFASTQTSPEASRSTDSSRVESPNTRQHFADAHSRGGRSALARRLWSAVGAGDTSAEVALAQLYLTGDGVPRSCEQARVLLKAASKNGNMEAQRQLRKLTGRDCR